MALGSLSENERRFGNGVDKQDSEHRLGLRVRFLDEDGRPERTLTAIATPPPTVRLLRSHSASALLHIPHPRRPSQQLTAPTPALYKTTEFDETDVVDASATPTFKKNCNVYSVNRGKTLTPERRKGPPKSIKPQSHERRRSSLAAETWGESAGELGGALGRIGRGIGRLLRRTASVRISEPDPVYKVAYLGNVLTGWAKGESCIEKPLSTLWRNYQQSTKPDVIMKLSVTNSGLKGFTKEHGLTEYWSHRITYCASPTHYPKLFCWVYRHEGKKLKHELRCHAVLCTKESVSKKITDELQVKLKQALVEFKKDRICKQNARLSLANSVYENPTMPRRKILLSVGALNYRPPLERSKSAPKLGAIEELCSEEDEEEAEMNTKNSMCDSWVRTSLHSESDLENYYTQTLDRRRSDSKSRNTSCPEHLNNRNNSVPDTDIFINIVVKDSQNKNNTGQDKVEFRLKSLESISESNESNDNTENKLKMLSQSNFLVTDSDDGSVSSGCETASTVTSDAEPSSLPSQYPPEEIQIEYHRTVGEKELVFERAHSLEECDLINNTPLNTSISEASEINSEEVNCVPIGEKNAFRRRSTYPPVGVDATIFANLENNFESLIDNLTDVESLNSSTETEVFKQVGDNDSACSDESGYSELLDNVKESEIGNTIMV